MITDHVDATGKAARLLGHGEMWFHTTSATIGSPHRVTFLDGIDVRPDGGHTHFPMLRASHLTKNCARSEID